MKTYIIGEAGVNHNGDIDLAYKLIDVAVEAGVDVVKFQTAVPKLVMTKDATKAKYQDENDPESESQIEMAEKIHLPLDAYVKLQEYCIRKGIKFLSTPFDLVSIDCLDELGQDVYKIPSGEITNLPYIKKICSVATKIILSTGMSTLKEIRDTLDLMIKYGFEKNNITLLHCTTQYPTPYEDVNLNAMLTIKKEFGVDVGYSDHTLGTEVPVAAVALGAKVIEKHFTLDKTLPGPDHKASLDPDELKLMVKQIRAVETAMGNGEKVVQDSEKDNIVVARKSIVASGSIKKGELFTEDNLTTKRPGSGVSPMKWEELLGTPAAYDFEEDELIRL